MSERTAGLVRYIWNICYYPNLGPTEFVEKFREECNIHESKFRYNHIYGTSSSDVPDGEVLKQLVEWVVAEVGVTQECVDCGYCWSSEDFLDSNDSFTKPCPDCEDSTSVSVLGVGNLREVMGDKP